MYDAVASMGAPKRPNASLLPSGHSLDLFVTLTDYHGYHQLVQIHDPPLIHELEHHHVLHFPTGATPSGEIESDFELDNAAGLAFAARATSSFPGAFPPARIVEMDEVVAQRRDDLAAAAPSSSRSCFPAHLRAGIDPATASFIDGSVLNNRPFQRGDLGDPRPAGLSRRSTGGWSTSTRTRRRRVAPRHHECRASSRPCAARCPTSRAPSRSPTSSAG